jgi:hypothetical protein
MISTCTTSQRIKAAHLPNMQLMQPQDTFHRQNRRAHLLDRDRRGNALQEYKGRGADCL